MSEIEDIARDLVALWQSPVIQGLSRADRNAAIEDTRNALIKACATVAQPAEQRLCKATVGGSSPPGGITLPESAPVILSSLPSGESDPSVMPDSTGADTNGEEHIDRSPATPEEIRRTKELAKEHGWPVTNGVGK